MNVALKWGHMKRHAGFLIEWVFTRANSSRRDMALQADLCYGNCQG